MTREGPESDLFLNTVVLGGSTSEKLAAAKAAGFGEVELWMENIASQPGGVAAVRRELRLLSLGLTDLQVLREFDGAPDELRAAKRDEAKRMLDTAVLLGAPMVLAPASTIAECVPGRVQEDLHWLAVEAAHRDLTIGYESLAWSTVNTTLAEAWACVAEVDEPNLGIVVDSFHMFIHGGTASDMDGIPMDRIVAVQLSDYTGTTTPDKVVEIARHHRLLPGDGNFPIATILDRLKVGGYEGPIGLEVFSDAYRARNPLDVAREAMESLRRVCGAAGLLDSESSAA